MSNQDDLNEFFSLVGTDEDSMIEAMKGQLDLADIGSATLDVLKELQRIERDMYRNDLFTEDEISNFFIMSEGIKKRYGIIDRWDWDELTFDDAND